MIARGHFFCQERSIGFDGAGKRAIYPDSGTWYLTRDNETRRLCGQIESSLELIAPLELCTDFAGINPIALFATRIVCCLASGEMIGGPEKSDANTSYHR